MGGIGEKGTTVVHLVGFTMARSHRCLAVMIALILTFATPALAEPGDPVVEFGDGGTVESHPGAMRMWRQGNWS